MPNPTTFTPPLGSDPRDHGETKTACLLCVDVQSYGRYLGNQKHEPAKDLSDFKVQYENLAFRRFKTYGDVPRLTGRIDATSAQHTIKGLETEGLPDGMSLSISGDVTMQK